MQPVQKKLIIAFWILALLDILGIVAGFEILHYIVKPLLIPALGLLLFCTDTTLPGKKLLLFGLFFSWMGDIFLLLESKHSLFFIFGLAGFLTTHIFYILYFLRIKSDKISRSEEHTSELQSQ